MGKRPCNDTPPVPELPVGRRPLRLDTASLADLQNLALALVLMWGPSRRQPAERRLRALVEGLAEDGALALVDAARQAEHIGMDFMQQRSDGAGENARFAPQAAMQRAVREQCPWVDDKNVSVLYSQACYYVWHG